MFTTRKKGLNFYPVLERCSKEGRLRALPPWAIYCLLLSLSLHIKLKHMFSLFTKHSLSSTQRQEFNQLVRLGENEENTVNVTNVWTHYVHLFYRNLNNSLPWMSCQEYLEWRHLPTNPWVALWMADSGISPWMLQLWLLFWIMKIFSDCLLEIIFGCEIRNLLESTVPISHCRCTQCYQRVNNKSCLNGSIMSGG